jgi:hypothetical protein
MDDLERDLRATFDRLADRAVPSAELVERTVERKDQSKRRRRAGIVSALAAVVVVVSVTAASIAGAGTHSSHLQVTGPTGVGVADDTTTTESTTTTTTVVPPPPPGTTHHYTVPAARPTPTTTTAPACTPASFPVAADLALLPDGDVQASFFLVSGIDHETHHYVLDDGTTGEDGLTKVFTPDQFGTHSYDMWVDDHGDRSCTEHYTFDVEPAAVTTTTMPGDTTTTSSPTDSTTLPTDTTVPATSTTIGH